MYNLIHGNENLEKNQINAVILLDMGHTLRGECVQEV
jgi:hypothetical protein